MRLGRTALAEVVVIVPQFRRNGENELIGGQSEHGKRRAG